MSDKLWDTAKGILASVAPVLGRALGGPFGAMAAREITAALLGEENATDDEAMAAEALRRATPDDLLKLKQAEHAFATRMRELEIDLARIDAGDRDSARRRQAETGDRMPGLIALAALAGFFGILSAMIFVDIPAGAMQPLLVMLGALGTLVTQIGAYYYGSSRGSAAKQAMLDRVLAKPGGRPGGAPGHG